MHQRFGLTYPSEADDPPRPKLQNSKLPSSQLPSQPEFPALRQYVFSYSCQMLDYG